MKAIGIVRRIDDLGRIVIPKEIRDYQGWPNGTPMEFFVSDEGVVIRKYHLAEEEQQIIDDLKNILKQTNETEVYEVINNALTFIEGR